MTDLRRSLRDDIDRIPRPDLWTAIEERAAGTAPEVGPARRLRRPPSRLLAALVALTLVAGVAVGLWSVTRDGGEPAGTSCGTWEPTGPKRSGSIYGVDALGPRDVWAAGYEVRGGKGFGLILNYDGRSWETVEHPDAGEFEDVWALSDTDIWVVGEKLLHYDGTRWLVFESPRPLGAYEVFGFSQVVVLAHDDAWAAGTFGTFDGQQRAFAAHWDGAAWSVVETPHEWAAVPSVAYGIAARSSDDVWLVGDRGSTAGSGVRDRPFALHWTGSEWHPVPTAIRERGALWDVAVSGDAGAWAVGEGGRGALAEHFDGSRWHFVYNAATPTGFQGVAMVSPADVWVVGRDTVKHWNGDDNRWTSAVPAPGASLFSVDTAAGQVWAVGISSDYTTLIVHRC